MNKEELFATVSYQCPFVSAVAAAVLRVQKQQVQTNKSGNFQV